MIKLNYFTIIDIIFHCISTFKVLSMFQYEFNKLKLN